MHAALFWLSENHPAAHTVQLLLLSSSSASALLSVLRGLSTRVPALHAEQDALPLPAVRPAVQGAHVSASAAAAKVFCSQFWQATWPARRLALPGMHGKHEAEVLSGCEKPAGHSRQVDAGSVPPRYCPPKHAAHSCWFLRLVAMPGMHGRHAAWPPMS